MLRNDNVEITKKVMNAQFQGKIKGGRQDCSGWTMCKGDVKTFELSNFRMAALERKNGGNSLKRSRLRNELPPYMNNELWSHA